VIKTQRRILFRLRLELLLQVAMFELSSPKLKLQTGRYFRSIPEIDLRFYNHPKVTITILKVKLTLKFKVVILNNHECKLVFDI